MPSVFAMVVSVESVFCTPNSDVDSLALDASCKTKEDFIEDFKVLQGAAVPAKYVRTYSAVDQAVEPTCYVPGAILPAAKETGMEVILGLW